MQKDKIINIPMMFFGLAGCAVSYFLGEALLAFLNPLPYIIQAGIYMVFAASVCGAVILISETVAPGGYVRHWRTVFFKDSLRGFLIFIPVAFVIGLGTQFLYGLAGIQLFTEQLDFQGTMLICDRSGSMLDNDPEKSAVGAMLSYIGDEVQIGEYLGIITFNNEFKVLRGYKKLETEEERDELKELIENVSYDGGTDIQNSLLAGIDEIRKITGENPGLIILFSDGDAPLRYGAVQRAARGNSQDGREIPVNTIFYGTNQLNGNQMSRIAQITGGTYNYVSVHDTATDVFTQSRMSYTTEKLHLLQKTFGVKKNSPIRIALQILLTAIWCFSISVLVIIMIDNKNLIRDFLYWRILVSVAAGIAFTVLLNVLEYELSPVVRLVLMGFMVILFIPTYRMPPLREGER